MSTKWDNRFLQLAKHIAQWSKDPSTKVGAVIVDNNRLIHGVGYNGFPRGVGDTPERLHDRPTKYQLVVHAEVNAILAAGSRARGCTLYIWPSFAIPCICGECAKFAIQAGIWQVVGYRPNEINERWAESIAVARTMLIEAGIGIREVVEDAEI